MYGVWSNTPVDLNILVREAPSNFAYLVDALGLELLAALP